MGNVVFPRDTWLSQVYATRVILHIGGRFWGFDFLKPQLCFILARSTRRGDVAWVLNVL